MRNRYTYKQAGVDIDAGNRLVERIKPLAAATARAGTASDLGGFGGLFDLRAAGYADPVLVAATDGVGTKLKIATACDHHDTIGIDLVAMCVNDLVVQGAEPLFFLDYFSTGRLSVDIAESVVAGVAEGCRIAGCALIGGETAEMPGVYEDGDYDLAGFAVGAAERGRLLPRDDVAAGDVIIGLPASGLHSNGFSLVRRLVADLGLAFDAPAPFDASRSLGEALLEPTRIYVREALAAMQGGTVKAFAHITGGGIIENLPRVLPDELDAVIDIDAMPLPPVFRWLQSAGGIAVEEMARTFNCGIGFVAVTAPEQAAAVAGLLGADAIELGRLQPGSGSVVLAGDLAGW